MHVSGLRVVYDPDREPGDRVVRATLDDGTPIRPDDVYVVTANNFMVAGGSGFDALAGVPSDVTGILDLDALIDYLRSLPQPVRAPDEPRWTVARAP